MASLNALSESDAAAVARYKETASLSRGRLAEIQAEAAAHALAGGTTRHTEAEWMARMSWLCTMLLNTSEEALRAKHALMRAREQHIADQLQSSQSDALEERRASQALHDDRQGMEQQVHELGGRLRRQAVEGQQQRTRDASKAQALHEQVRPP